MYKGQAAVQPYAFQSTPHLRQETRTISAPSIVTWRHWRSSTCIFTVHIGKRTDSNNATSSHPKSAAPSGSGMASVGHLYQQALPKRSSADDMSINKSTGPELAKRYRRRSLNTLDTHLNPPAGSEESELVIRSGSMTSLNKVESTKGSVNSQESIKPVAAAAKNVVVPPRVSSEPNKRMASPSPLSRQANETESPVKPRTYASVAAQASTCPGTATRCRREQPEREPATLTKEQHQNRIEDDMDAEQMEIARRQEAAGIGAGIYSGQGGFIGSTDNLSISSTASSASMMLRKMGQGARKGARSIKGLFRPKSVIGVPAADGPIVQPSVSMVTVEAERHRVNVKRAC
ncbi:hypothetical protein MRB53_041141 [Persea americana]|nr:hypothetical protein MRB53_041141 [Persea americana]